MGQGCEAASGRRKADVPQSVPRPKTLPFHYRFDRWLDFEKVVLTFIGSRLLPLGPVWSRSWWVEQGAEEAYESARTARAPLC
jgi:hypothetical protein